VLAGSFAANLLHDLYADRRRQYATLLAVGFSTMQTTIVAIAVEPRRRVQESR
jgi:hypothetical protein